MACSAGVARTDKTVMQNCMMALDCQSEGLVRRPCFTSYDLFAARRFGATGVWSWFLAIAAGFAFAMLVPLSEWLFR